MSGRRVSEEVLVDVVMIGGRGTTTCSSSGSATGSGSASGPGLLGKSDTEALRIVEEMASAPATNDNERPLARVIDPSDQSDP